MGKFVTSASQKADRAAVEAVFLKDQEWVPTDDGQHSVIRLRAQPEIRKDRDYAGKHYTNLARGLLQEAGIPRNELKTRENVEDGRDIPDWVLNTTLLEQARAHIHETREREPALAGR